jgi:hypothetical protein
MALHPLTARWLDAVSTGVVANITQLYAPDAVLLPTVAVDIRTSREAVERYFVLLMQRPGIHVTTWGEEHVQLVGEPPQDGHQLPRSGTLVISGNYSFVWDEGDLPSRYTFVWEVVNDRVQILTHHSSAVPRA